MSIFNNNMITSEGRGGSAENAVKNLPNTDVNTSKGSEESATGLPIFQLLLSGAVSGPMLAKAAGVAADSPADAPLTADTNAATPALNLFMALLPALPVQTPVNTPMPSRSIDAITAGAASPQLPSLQPTSTSQNAALESAVSALLTAASLPTPKKDETTTTSGGTESFDHALMTLDRTQQQAPTAVPTPSTTATARDALADLPITHHEWPTALGHRLIWMAGEGMQKAELRINPEHLGPIHIHIQIENDQTDIQFAALSPQAREALETSIPKLRELFSQQGLNLGQAQVFSQAQQQSGGRQQSLSQQAMDPQAEQPESVSLIKRIHVSTRLLDDYA